MTAYGRIENGRDSALSHRRIFNEMMMLRRFVGLHYDCPCARGTLHARNNRV
jgi:hypothetical protein